MTLTATRTRAPRFVRARRELALEPLSPIPARGLGLAPDELEELLLAVGDREDMVGPDARARLARGRRALERELDAAMNA